MYRVKKYKFWTALSPQLISKVSRCVCQWNKRPPIMAYIYTYISEKSVSWVYFQDYSSMVLFGLFREIWLMFNSNCPRIGIARACRTLYMREVTFKKKEFCFKTWKIALKSGLKQFTPTNSLKWSSNSPESKSMVEF